MKRVLPKTECPYCSNSYNYTVEQEKCNAGLIRVVVTCLYPLGCGRAFVIEYYVPPLEIKVLKIEGYEEEEMPAMA